MEERDLDDSLLHLWGSWEAGISRRGRRVWRSLCGVVTDLFSSKEESREATRLKRHENR